jgi:transcriptional regulator with XRE-family HTH domain
MTLPEYLAEAAYSQAQFARSIGVSKQAVQRYVSGERIPDRRIMGRIALATGGKVTANDFFGLAA